MTLERASPCGAVPSASAISNTEHHRTAIARQGLNQVESGRHWKFANKPMPVNAGLPPSPCLDRPTPSSTKGGTVIAEHITELRQQHQALAEPDRVRPDGCPTCGIGPLHVHERRERKLRGHPEAAAISVLVFRCGRRECRAVWRVLPAFLARHLWRAWSTVAEALTPTPKRRSSVPSQTRARWRARLRERAAVLVAVLGSSGQRSVLERAVALGSAALRGEVIDAFGGLTALPVLCALVHHLVPGVRVM